VCDKGGLWASSSRLVVDAHKLDDGRMQGGGGERSRGGQRRRENWKESTKESGLQNGSVCNAAKLCCNTRLWSIPTFIFRG
jgi:hypothetical protein